MSTINDILLWSATGLNWDLYSPTAIAQVLTALRSRGVSVQDRMMINRLARGVQRDDDAHAYCGDWYEFYRLCQHRKVINARLDVNLLSIEGDEDGHVMQQRDVLLPYLVSTMLTGEPDERLRGYFASGDPITTQLQVHAKVLRERAIDVKNSETTPAALRRSLIACFDEITSKTQPFVNTHMRSSLGETILTNHRMADISGYAARRQEVLGSPVRAGFQASFRTWWTNFIGAIQHTCDGSMWRVFGRDDRGEHAPLTPALYHFAMDNCFIVNKGSHVSIDYYAMHGGDREYYSMRYNEYAGPNARPLSDADRTSMITALHQMLDIIDRAGAVFLLGQLTLRTVYIDESGEPTGHVQDTGSGALLIADVVANIRYALAQLDATDARALAVMQDTINDQQGYGDKITGNHYTFANPFHVIIHYKIPGDFPHAKCTASTQSEYFITVGYSDCDEGECMDKALTYTHPSPTPDEHHAIAALIDINHPTTMLSAFKSSDWMYVTNVTKETWTVVACNPPELAQRAPWSIDLNRTCVIFAAKSHAGRVTAISPPDTKFLTVEWQQTTGRSHVSSPSLIVSNCTSHFTWTVVEANECEPLQPTAVIDVPIYYLFGNVYHSVKSINRPRLKDGAEKKFVHMCLVCHQPAFEGNTRSLALLAGSPSIDSFGDSDGLGAIPLMVLKEHHTFDDIGKMVRVMATDSFLTECCTMIAKLQGNDVADHLRFKNESPDEFRRVWRIKPIYVIKPTGGEGIKVTLPINCEYTAEDLHLKYDDVLILTKVGSKFYRVVDFNITVDGVKYEPRGHFACRRGCSNEDTLALVTDRLGKSIDSVEQFKQVTSIPWAIVTDILGTDRNGYRSYKYHSNSRDFGHMDVDTKVVMWQDNDGILLEVIGENDYDAPKMSQSDIEKTCIILAWDIETVNLNMFSITETDTYAVLVDGYYVVDGVAHTLHEEGYNCMQRFVAKLAEVKRQYNDRKIYAMAFNGASFDVYSLVDEIAVNHQFKFGMSGNKSTFVKNGSKVLELSTNNFIMHDTRRYIVASLKQAAKDLNCLRSKSCWDHHKTQMLFDSCWVDITKPTNAFEAATMRLNGDTHNVQVTRRSHSEKQLEAAIGLFFKKLHDLPATEYMVNESHAYMTPSQLKESAEEYQAALVDVKDKSAYEAYCDYCQNDCVVCYQITNALREALLKSTGGKMDVLKYMTLSQGTFKFVRKMVTEQKYSRVITRPDGKTQTERKKMKLLKPHNAYDYEFIKSTLLAGMSIVTPFVPDMMTVMQLLLIDVVSLYPYVAIQCPFVIGDDYYWVKEFVPNQIGYYAIKITRQADVPVIPLKARDSGLGSHFWEYKGQFCTRATWIDILVHRHFGGECEIIPEIGGIVAAEWRRGVTTRPYNMFKVQKQMQDWYKNFTSDTIAKGKHPLYSAAYRCANKFAPNSATGKTIEEPHTDKMEVIADPTARRKFIDDLIADHQSYNMMHHIDADVEPHEVPLVNRVRSTISEVIAPSPYASIVKWKVPFERVVEQDSSFKSVFNGVLIYAWSRAHMMLSIVGNAYKARALMAVETDGAQIDRVKYEEYMRREHPEVVNPYDVPAPFIDDKVFCMDKPVVDPLPDNIDTMKCEARRNNLREQHRIAEEVDAALTTQRIGRFYCPAAARAFDSTYVARKIPLNRVDEVTGCTMEMETDFGDFTAEAGISRSGQFESTECCWIGKKFYYLSDFEHTGPKCTAKGFGGRAVNATDLAQYEFDHRNESLEFDEKYHQLLIDVMQRPPVLNKGIYEQLLSGQAVDSAQRRFVGRFDKNAPGSTSLKSSLQINRNLPPTRFQVILRSFEQSDAEMQCDSGRVNGPPPCIARAHGVELTHEEMLQVVDAVDRTVDKCPGLTIQLRGRGYYLTNDTIHYIKRYRHYFTNVYSHTVVNGSAVDTSTV